MIDDLEQLDEKWLKTVLEEAEKIAWPTFIELSGGKAAALARIALAAKRAKAVACSFGDNNGDGTYSLKYETVI